jgi:CRISPR-associated protein Cmr2
MTKYMLLFSLGPVQSFIAQARKTRDLWLGSYLLSLLMEAGMSQIASDKLVFPADKTIKGIIPDLPNKYIATFDTLEDAKKAAKESEEAIKECWHKLSEDVWWKIIHRHTDASNYSYLHNMWERQTKADTFFEIFWAIAEGDESEYDAWLTRTQEALAARKQLRLIAPYSDKAISDRITSEVPFPLAEPGEKSTISGEREALHHKNQPARTFWRNFANSLDITSEIKAGGGERLDAIDTIKRFAYRTSAVQAKLKQSLSIQANEEETVKKLSAVFPSTSSVATASFVEQLLWQWQKINKTVLDQWLAATAEPLEDMDTRAIPYLEMEARKRHIPFDVLKRDGDCYFSETFTAQRLEKDYGIQPRKEAEERAKQGQIALANLFRETSSLAITRPTPYYAMIQMDGDKMGTLLGKVKDKEEHKGISGALSRFSRNHAPELVERQYPGRLIYAGGDDVFALAPLARDIKDVSSGEIVTVLNLVDRLQRQYVDDVRPKVKDVESQQKVTASIGVAIAHHYTSLSYVRRVSKDAEARAKKHYGRNALVVTIMRRSGEQTQVGCKWHYDGLAKEAQPIHLFTEFYRLLREDIISPKCIYTLLEEARNLLEWPVDEENKETQEQVKEKQRSAQISEIKRVLIRQTDSKQREHFTKEAAEAMAKNIVALADAMDATADKEYKENHPNATHGEKKSTELHSTERRYGLVEVLGWLLVMNFLARKEEE